MESTMKTVKEVAEELGYSEDRVLRKCKEGEFDHIGGKPSEIRIYYPLRKATNVPQANNSPDSPSNDELKPLETVDDKVNFDKDVIEARKKTAIALAEKEKAGYLRDKLFIEKQIADVNDLATKLTDVAVREAKVKELEEKQNKTKTELDDKFNKDTAILNEIRDKYREFDDKKKEADEYYDSRVEQVKIDIANETEKLASLKGETTATVNNLIDVISQYVEIANKESTNSYYIAEKTSGSTCTYHNNRSNMLWSCYLKLKEILRGLGIVI